MTTTIVAVASPPGPGRRSVLRLSGPDVRALVGEVFVPDDEGLLETRGVQRGRLDDGRGTQPALLFWMPGPGSYTREDVAELHLPGAPPLAAAALRRLLSLGAETAAPGEFTRRAFLNGRLDLSRAEGVLALVEARSDDERRAAARLFGGGLARRVEGLRERLEELRALAEASLDFDESDTGHVPAAEIEALAAGAAAALDEALAWEVGRQAPSALPRVLFFGAPNAGKSSLWNALVPAGDALVATLAGTTRDAREAVWEAGTRPCLLIDAPGLDAAASGADAAAQGLASRELEGADLVLWVVDAATARTVEVAPEARALGDVPRLVLWNKTDLPGAAPGPDERLREALGLAGDAAWVAVSASTGAGLGGVAARVAARLGGGGALGRELFERHREALGAAAGALEEGRRHLAGGAPLDLVAEAFRAATAELDRILGRTRPEDLLERIFARFCIGK